MKTLKAIPSSQKMVIFVEKDNFHRKGVYLAEDHRVSKW